MLCLLSYSLYSFNLHLITVNYIATDESMTEDVSCVQFFVLLSFLPWLSSLEDCNNTKTENMARENKFLNFQSLLLSLLWQINKPITSWTFSFIIFFNMPFEGMELLAAYARASVCTKIKQTLAFIVRKLILN